MLIKIKRSCYISIFSLSNSFLFHLFWSVFINSYKIVNFNSAYWALFQVLAASDASSIMFARHVNTIFIIFVTNNTGTRKSFLADINCFYSAYISLTWTNFKNRFVLNLIKWTYFPFVWKSSPSTICCSHVFNEIFISNGCNCCMNIWKMLILWETEEIGLFAANSDFFVWGNLTG